VLVRLWRDGGLVATYGKPPGFARCRAYAEIGWHLFYTQVAPMALAGPCLRFLALLGRDGWYMPLTSVAPDEMLGRCSSMATLGRGARLLACFTRSHARDLLSICAHHVHTSSLQKVTRQTLEDLHGGLGSVR
jgi:hypothetical protein